MKGEEEDGRTETLQMTRRTLALIQRRETKQNVCVSGRGSGEQAGTHQTRETRQVMGDRDNNACGDEARGDNVSRAKRATKTKQEVR